MDATALWVCLAAILVAFAFSFSPWSLLSATLAPPHDILVIGGGMAGLAAASHLQHLGWPVTVLEARDRAGGRIHTLLVNDTPLEMGALFLHRTSINDVFHLAQSLQLRTVPYLYRNCTYFDHDGSAVNDADYDEMLQYFRSTMAEDYLAERATLVPGDDQPISATLDAIGVYDDLSGYKRRLFDLFCFQYIVQDMQANLQDISTDAYDDGWDFPHTDTDVFLPEGMDALVAHLSHGINIHFNAKVDKVELVGPLDVTDGHPAVAVHVAGKHVLYAEHVVVALPIGVLKSRTVRFAPPLPEDIDNAIIDLGVSKTIKVGLCWNLQDVFWPVNTSRSYYFHKFAHHNHSNATSKYGKGEHLEFINIHQLTGNGCLLAATEGQFASRLQQMTPAEVVERLMEDLRQMFGPNISGPTNGVAISDWIFDPFTRGGYGHWRVDSDISANNAFTKGVDDLLFFAGEHTSTRYPGSVHGAYESGINAANAILYARLRLHCQEHWLYPVTCLCCLAVLWWLYNKQGPMIPRF